MEIAGIYSMKKLNKILNNVDSKLFQTLDDIRVWIDESSLSQILHNIKVAKMGIKSQ